MPENMKYVYSIDKGTLGQKKLVESNYKINSLYETELPPIEDALILTWDAKTGSWYDSGKSVDESLKDKEQQLTDVMLATAELFEQNLDIITRIEALEANIVPLEK